MSFLSQLRQQQPTTQQGLKLCYLLEVDHTTKTIKLRLSLAQLQQGKLIKITKPYRIQRQHLLHHPSFLETSDVKILELIVNIKAEFQQLDDGQLIVAINSDFLFKMIKTQRCFILNNQQQWQGISQGTKTFISPHWKLSHCDNYQLSWQTENKTWLAAFEENNNLYFAYNVADCSLSVTEPALTDEAIQAINNINHLLPISQVSHFIQQHQIKWNALKLPLPEEIPHSFIHADLIPVLQLNSETEKENQQNKTGRLSLLFRYVNDQYCTTISFKETREILDYYDGCCIHQIKRNTIEEKKYLKKLSPLLNDFSSTEHQNIWQSGCHQVWMNFFTKTYPILKKSNFQFWITPKFPYHYVIANHWLININDANNENIELNLSVEIEQQKIKLNDLLKQLQIFNNLSRNENHDEVNYLTLPDGRLLLLPENKLNDLMSELTDFFSQSNGQILIPKKQFNRLHHLHQQSSEKIHWQGSIELLDLAISLHETPKILKLILNGVNAELRPYQWLGVYWLQHLKKHNVNGLLADDMGLGKTLQTLAHLSLEKQQGDLNSPALIVAPTSLIYNWVAEIKQFTPHLNYKVMHGLKRNQAWGKLKQYDIIITSYQLILNDQSQWQQQPISWMILDEAQKIKNAKTQVSQSLRNIKSHYRLCLSGTPVENNLAELWSLLDFLMPGCLGNLNQFKKNFQKPIEVDFNQNKLVQLQQHIMPFMLRRTKQQVAADLPEKTEIYQRIHLFEEQQNFYEEQKLCEINELNHQLNNEDHHGKKQILLLTALLKLRQVCCDPALLNHPEIKSAKREHCVDMLKELIAEGRKVLLFSQFTQMLNLIADDLDKLNIQYLKLTGQSKNRQNLVDQFQQGEIPIFLISLKAGGVGLNLTAADTVIHYDPWWNNAAEQQATDRAHRIGQNKPVFVYKLITENTIEEKIALLQQRKAQLSQHVHHQAQLNAEQFALKLEDLMSLWQQEINQ